VVLDSSAVVAIVLKEAGYQGLLAKIEAAPGVAIGAPTVVETLIVLTARLRGESLIALKELLLAAEVEVIPFSDDHSRVALRAHVRFGKGRHRAALNFGDCLSYATASVARQSLLFVGDDFSRTDIVAA
jgi:ribonuclease VapC